MMTKSNSPGHAAAAAATILWPFYTTTCVSWHTQLKTEGFCGNAVLLPTTGPC